LSPLSTLFVQRIGSKGTSTAIDLAMRIGPHNAEDAAKQGRELTALGKLIFVKTR
jgi:hypothetical protein